MVRRFFIEVNDETMAVVVGASIEVNTCGHSNIRPLFGPIPDKGRHLSRSNDIIQTGYADGVCK